MKVNKELLPMKGHFFLFNAEALVFFMFTATYGIRQDLREVAGDTHGLHLFRVEGSSIRRVVPWKVGALLCYFIVTGTAPLVPYLSTYAKQLGFSSYIVGIIYTILPISGLIAKPLFGAIADRFRVQKTLFVLFQIVTAFTFLGIYFIPEDHIDVNVQLSCGNGESFIKSCGLTGSTIGNCSLYQVTSDTSNTECRMTCDMSSSAMWQTVCEHWHIPQYCYSDTHTINFTAAINTKKTVLNKECADIFTDNVSLDGNNYVPRCNPTNNLINTNESCSLKCGDPQETFADTNMTCVKDSTHFTICNTSKEKLGEKFFNDNAHISCETSCDVDKPWRIMEICEGWLADDSATCQPKMTNGEEFPPYLEFTALVPLSKTLDLDHCVFFKVQNILLPDGSTHYTNCPSVGLNTAFHPSCTISCDNSQVNELLSNIAIENDSTSSQITQQFWLFFMLMIASWVGQAVVVSIADAICFDMLGDKPTAYGRQRLWGSVGWGVFSLLTGVLIDEFSRGSATKDYTVAFVLMFVFLSLDAIVSYTLKYKASKMSVNILKDVGTLLSSWHTAVFLLWTVCVGVCTGLLWQFLFWHLEDVSCTSAGYIKTLQGLVSAIQAYGGEIPFMFMSGPILKRIGHTNMMSIVLLAFGIRFILYSCLTNPWWVLPIELLQGITYGMFYPTMTSYASVVAPPGTEATVQGLVGAIFEGVGTSIGSFVGGVVYEKYGGSNTFLSFGVGALVFCVVHLAAQLLLRKYRGDAATGPGEYSTIIRYAPPTDAIHMLADDNEMT